MKISVVIPLYNKENSIKGTINSVISQSFENIEILVVDDGSKDASVSVVESISDDRIRLIKTKNNGVSSARNTGVKNATGEYIFFLDADDVISDNCFEELINLVKEYPQASIFTANFILKVPYRKDVVFCKRNDKGIVPNPFKELYKRRIFLRTGNMLIRYECFDTVGLFNEELSKYEDLEYVCRLIHHFMIAYTPRVVLQYDRKYSNLSNTHTDISKEFASIVDLTGKSIYEKLLLSEYLAVTIHAKILVEKKYQTAIDLINKNIWSMHYIIFSYALSKLMRLMNKIK